MSKANTFENDFLRLIFHGVAIPSLATNATVSPSTLFYIALHTQDPGESDSQTQFECTYTGYARVQVLRSTAGFTITGNVVTLAGDMVFGSRTDSGAPQNVTHWSVGLANSGTGKILYSGAVTPITSVVQNSAPKLLANTQIVED